MEEKKEGEGLRLINKKKTKATPINRIKSLLSYDNDDDDKRAIIKWR